MIIGLSLNFKTRFFIFFELFFSSRLNILIFPNKETLSSLRRRSLKKKDEISLFRREIFDVV